MIYNTEKQRTEIKTQLSMLFAEFSTNLADVCRELDLNHNSEWQHINRNKIHHARIETLIHSIAPDRYLQFRNGKLVIARKWE